ncbi:hypothetical protein OWV82_011201 [Melia azedarach]|uniref:Uncharacterized protein n=1 Tax=Melia azedarach TaxID=155640 RepID=A0ACC1XXF1_MELAZ|nr:hypothetical protein OWV82_011201 [Melia azedarach]
MAEITAFFKFLPHSQLQKLRSEFPRVRTSSVLLNCVLLLWAQTIKQMAVLIAIFNGLRLCVTTLWDLQELRFANIFDDVSFIAITIIMAAVSCFISLRSR